MPIAFSRSLRSLETDSHRPSAFGLALGAAFALAWGLWFVLARVAMVEVAETARLEVNRAAHALETPVAGTITSVHLELGQVVHAGDILAELDSENLRLSRGVEQARRAATSLQIDALSAELKQGERALADRRQVDEARGDEARAHTHGAEVAALLSETIGERSQRLQAEGLASETDALRAKAEAEQQKLAAEEARLTVSRIASEERATGTERSQSLLRLRRDLAVLEGQRATSTALIAELDHAIELRHIRAPIAGRLGDVVTLRVGSVLKEGDRLGYVIPEGDVRIVAEFLPASAVGRVRPGQRARLRADGFPWTEYGMLTGSVRRVGSEPSSGLVRVELDVDPKSDPRIPRQHGLPGVLEVEVERISPAALLLRVVGRRLAAPAEARSVSAEPAGS